MFELTVTVKDSDTQLKRQFLIYDNCWLNEDDPVIREHIDTTVKDFGKPPESVKLKFTMEVQ